MDDMTEPTVATPQTDAPLAALWTLALMLCILGAPIIASGNIAGWVLMSGAINALIVALAVTRLKR